MVGKENLEVGNAKIILSNGEKPSLQEYVQQTETQQLRTMSGVRKHVRLGANKFRDKLEGRIDPDAPTIEDPFKRLVHGEEYFVKQWLKESEFQRKSLAQQAIKDRIYQGNSEQVLIKVYAGMPTFFNVLARNDENYDQTYKVDIFDQNLPLGAEQPDPKTLPLRVIADGKEQDLLE